MTLILALGNRDQFIQISDRRLSANRQIIDDESNKAGTLTCANARLLFGFTGLAAYRTFRTQQWILDTLHASGPPDFLAGGILDRLTIMATREFCMNTLLKELSQSEKRLSIMFSGYLDQCSPPLLACAILTNFQDFSKGVDSLEAWDHFECVTSTEDEPSEQNSFVQRIGIWQAMTHDDENALRALLKERKPARAIIGKGVEIIRSMSERPSARGTIGKQLSSIVLSSDPANAVSAGYHTNRATYVTYLPDQVLLRADTPNLVIMDQTFQTLDQSDPKAILVPQVGRNQACPCGSGKKYKYCHGRAR